MFSLQKFLGKDDKFFSLLEASAEEASQSVRPQLALSNWQNSESAEFHQLKEADKQITEQITALVHSYVTELEREDIRPERRVV
jgi:hypothetical protein